MLSSLGITIRGLVKAAELTTAAELAMAMVMVMETAMAMVMAAEEEAEAVMVMVMVTEWALVRARVRELARAAGTGSEWAVEVAAGTGSEWAVEVAAGTGKAWAARAADEGVQRAASLASLACAQEAWAMGVVVAAAVHPVDRRAD
jgi:hypothetical protein